MRPETASVLAMAELGVSEMERMNTFGIGADAQRGLGAGMTLPLLFLATVVWWIWQRHKANLESGLPGTFGLPFIGETLTYVAKMKSPLGNFVDEKTKRLASLRREQCRVQ